MAPVPRLRHARITTLSPDVVVQAAVGSSIPPPHAADGVPWLHDPSDHDGILWSLSLLNV
jgi:hypothetical protein